jgi:hypothetical protein
MKTNIIYVNKKYNLSLDFYTEIRNFSLGSDNYFDREHIEKIINILQKDLSDLLINDKNKFSNDNKKYLTEILLSELDTLKKENYMIMNYNNNNDNNYIEKIYLKLKDIKKNLLIIFADFLNKENVFTFINAIKFHKKLEKFSEKFLINNNNTENKKKISTKILIDLLRDWKILHKNLLEYDSRYFKNEYKIALNEIKEFLIFLIYELENRKKIFSKFFWEIFLNNNNNIKTNNFIKINLIFDFFNVKFKNYFRFEENLGEIFKEFFAVFFNLRNLFAFENGIYRLKDEIRFLLKNFHFYYYDNRNLLDLSNKNANNKYNYNDVINTEIIFRNLNENVIKGICSVYYNAMEKFKSKEMVNFFLKIFEDMLELL